MTKLYLIRHAEAEGNLYRRIHGQYDSLLTVNGYRQIEALKERFANVPIDAAYSSDLFRARTTLQLAICEPKGLPLHTRADLREISVGEWEDETWGEMDFLHHEEMMEFTQTSPHFKAKDGESFEEVRQRVSKAILDIAQAHSDQTVAVCSHGTAMRNTLALFKGLSVAETRTMGHSDNTAVTLLEIENGKVNIVFADDNSHLSESISTLQRQGWWKNKSGSSPDENLWYTPLDISQPLHQGLYLASRHEAWTDLGRDPRLFNPQWYLEGAQACRNAGPQFLLCAQRKTTIVGLLQMDPAQNQEDNAGYISFFYMLPEHRNRGLGIQMMGQAVSTYRPMGRDKLQLSCANDNPAANRFYEKFGFRKKESWETPFGTDMNLMEKYIGYDLTGAPS